MLDHPQLVLFAMLIVVTICLVIALVLLYRSALRKRQSPVLPLDIPDPGPVVTFQINKWDAVSSMVVFIATYGGSGIAYLFSSTRNRVGDIIITAWALMLIVFLALLFASCQRWIFARGPILAIDEYGIDERRTGFGLIEWSRITRCRRENISFCDMLVLRVENFNDFRRQLPFWPRFLTKLNSLTSDAELHISFQNITPSLETALRCIAHHRPDLIQTVSTADHDNPVPTSSPPTTPSRGAGTP